LKGEKKLDRETLFWHFPTYLQGSNASGARDTSFRTKPVSAIRKGKWKLLQYFEELEFGDGPLPALELYDLEADIAESNNLADSMPAKRDELLADMVAWRKEVNAPVPTEHNPAYEG
jgi:arylsulfatase A-like enzyme